MLLTYDWDYGLFEAQDHSLINYLCVPWIKKMVWARERAYWMLEINVEINGN